MKRRRRFARDGSLPRAPSPPRAAHCGALLASAANEQFFRGGATSTGLHGLAWLLLAVAAMFLLACAADRSLSRVGRDL
ncbi:hypothetical protein [Streptomyces canus]|uniref:hypothetical protein n=1 Tax=Streptomyces canus TaxID=58343 RepID=UPI000749E3F8|nr:hypothetical protein [Streptomyces canus]KUN02194.1 hypothetical protein AQI96_40235 [Streptomyces canus]